MSWANHKLQSGRPQAGCRLLLFLLRHLLQSSHSPMNSQVSEPSVSRIILNNNADNRHPCRTPTVVRKESPAFPFSSTARVASSSDDLMTSISRLSILYSFKTRFLAIDEINAQLILVFQVLFHQQPQVEYLFSGTGYSSVF